MWKHATTICASSMIMFLMYRSAFASQINFWKDSFLINASGDINISFAFLFLIASSILVKYFTKILDAIKNKKAKLIFISPEALIKNESFQKLICEANALRYIRNIIIDEAHIVVACFHKAFMPHIIRCLECCIVFLY